jgi:P-type Mg2+ transporter
LIERFMIAVGPVSTLFDLATFAMLLLFFHATETFFRTGWFVESLVTQILMIFAVRTRRSLFASRLVKRAFYARMARAGGWTLKG